MSFIYDTALLTELLKIGQQQGEKYEDPESYAYRQSMAQMVKNVLDNIEKQAAPPEEKAQDKSDQISYEDDPSKPNAAAPQLNSTSEESLGALVQWLSYNKMTVNGKRVAYDSSEMQQAPDQNYVFYKLEGNSGFLERGDRTIDKRGYYVNKELLTKFIVSRQAAIAKTPNKVEQTQLNDLIGEANRLLGANINPQYQKPEEAEVVVDDGTLMDKLPRVIDTEHPLAGNGDLALTYVNVKTSDAFHAWLGQSNIAMKVDDKSATWRDEGFDQCAVINALYQRAQRFSMMNTKETKAYLQRMVAIAKESNCTLSSQQGKPQGQPGQAGPNPAQIQGLATLRPFNSNNVNFREILLFTSKYAPLANRPEIKQMAQQIATSVQAAKTLMNSPTDIIMLENLTDSSDLAPYKALTRQPVPLADVLYTIVYNAGVMYQDFANVAANVLEDSSLVQQIKQQIDAGGPWNSNMDDINQLRKDLAEDTQSGGRR